MRSKLFVPASRPELFAKALGGAADALSFDLEDAVAESRKAEARATLAAALHSPEFGASSKTIIVRVNGLTTVHFMADLAAMVAPCVDLINIPKLESPDEVHAIVAALDKIEAECGMTRSIAILANIESPRGLRRAADIAAAHPRVAGLQLGFGDLFEPLGIDRNDVTAVHAVQLAVRLAAGEAGVWVCDAAYGAVKNLDGYKAEAMSAKRLGYIGKTCVHPNQVALANEVFCPGEEETAFAQRVVTAAEAAKRDGVGAFMVDGRMIDEPFIKRARAIVAMAGKLVPREP